MSARVRPADEILHDLEEVCVCQEGQDPQCLFCEAREQILAQQRTITHLTALVPKKEPK